jgi:hypothetical protein
MGAAAPAATQVGRAAARRALGTAGHTNAGSKGEPTRGGRRPGGPHRRVIALLGTPDPTGQRGRGSPCGVAVGGRGRLPQGPGARPRVGAVVGWTALLGLLLWTAGGCALVFSWRVLPVCH